MTLQYRDAIGGDVRSFDDAARQVVARVCSFDAAPDTYRTTWSPQAFSDSLKAQMPTVCWGHDHRSVIGSVVDYSEQPDGLDVTIQFADFDAVPQARAAYSLIKDGHIRGWSFGFANGQTQPDPKHRGAMQFTRADLYEVSPVVRPSVPGTRTVSVRSEDGETRDMSTETLAGTLGTAFAEALASGQRSVTVTIDEGTGSVHVDHAIDDADETATAERADTGTQAVPAAETETDGNLPTLLLDIDSHHRRAQALLDGIDAETLPDEVRQALGLFGAASVAIDEALEVAGVSDDDPDDERSADLDDAEQRAAQAEASALLDQLATDDDTLRREAHHRHQIAEEEGIAGQVTDLDAEAAAALATLNGIR